MCMPEEPGESLQPRSGTAARLILEHTPQWLERRHGVKESSRKCRVVLSMAELVPSPQHLFILRGNPGKVGQISDGIGRHRDTREIWQKAPVVNQDQEPFNERRSERCHVPLLAL